MIEHSDKKVVHDFTKIQNKIIVLPEISESPITYKQNIRLPGFEKLITDMYINPELYHIRHEQEIRELYRNIAKTHSFNIPMLLRYASRRNRKKQIAAMIGFS